MADTLFMCLRYADHCKNEEQTIQFIEEVVSAFHQATEACSNIYVCARVGTFSIFVYVWYAEVAGLSGHACVLPRQRQPISQPHEAVQRRSCESSCCVVLAHVFSHVHAHSCYHDSGSHAVFEKINLQYACCQ